MIPLLLAVLTAAMPTPQPWPAPLKTIATVRSSPFCTTVRENIFGAVDALRANDAIASRGDTLLTGSMYRGMTAMDEMRLENLSTSLVNNIARIDNLLSDERRFPRQQNTADQQALQKAKDQLQAIEDKQKQMLNLLYGMYATMSMNDLAAAGDRNMMRSIAGGSVRSMPTPMPSPNALPSPSAGTGFGFHNNPLSEAAQSLDVYRAQAAAAETPAIETLNALVSRCR